MYTHCPECGTAFRITTVQLRMGQGNVRCSKCETLFDAISSLSDIAFEDHDSEFRKLPTLPLSQALPPPVRDETEDHESVSGPQTNGDRSTESRATRFGWLSGCAGMIALLILQISAFEGASLVQRPKFRPWFEKLCKTFDCALPSYRNPAEIEILERSLEPFGKDALEFKLVLVNGARFEQAFPRLKLDLIRLNGRLLARRVFNPDEYALNRAGAPGPMPVGKPFEIRLTIIRPSGEIGGYQFSLI